MSKLLFVSFCLILGACGPDYNVCSVSTSSKDMSVRFLPPLQLSPEADLSVVLYCGDKVCNNNEDCSTCPDDCGICPARCGDGICNDSENCMSCSQDCGDCYVAPTSSPTPSPSSTLFCGDHMCNNNETCQTCSCDCGECPPPPPHCDNDNNECKQNCSHDCDVNDVVSCKNDCDNKKRDCEDRHENNDCSHNEHNDCGNDNPSCLCSVNSHGNGKQHCYGHDYKHHADKYHGNGKCKYNCK